MPLPATDAPNWPPPPSGWTNIFSRVPDSSNRNAAPAPGPAVLSCGEPIRTFAPTDATAVPNPVDSAGCGLAIAPVSAPVVPLNVKVHDACTGPAVLSSGAPNDQVGADAGQGRAEPGAGRASGLAMSSSRLPNEAVSDRRQKQRPRPSHHFDPARRSKSWYWLRPLPRRT